MCKRVVVYRESHVIITSPMIINDVGNENPQTCRQLEFTFDIIADTSILRPILEVKMIRRITSTIDPSSLFQCGFFSLYASPGADDFYA